MENIVEARNVTKVFKFRQHSNSFLKDFFLPTQQSFRALDDVSLALKKGEILGLLGPNGSGKTTFTKCLCGLLQPTEGTIFVNGKPVEDSLEEIGVMLGYSMIYYRLTGYSNLKYFAKIYGVKNYRKRIDEISRFLEIDKWLYNYVETYSLGMKSKLAMARALIHDPEILFLDEPTLGLDPAISINIRHEIKKSGKTILLTTHYMDEAQELCDKVAIINRGKIVAIDTTENLKKSIEGHAIANIEISEHADRLFNELKKQDFAIHVSQTHNKLRVILLNKSSLNELLLLLTKYKIEKLSEEEPKLEDVFLKIVGQQNEEIPE